MGGRRNLIVIIKSHNLRDKATTEVSVLKNWTRDGTEDVSVLSNAQPPQKL